METDFSMAAFQGKQVKAEQSDRRRSHQFHGNRSVKNFSHWLFKFRFLNS